MSFKIDYSKLDSGCAPLVEYFNLQGLSTFMSCQGHGTTSQSLFYISFSDAVTDDDILNFQKRHLDSRGCFCANGHFSKRVFIYTDAQGDCALYNQWEYVVGSVAAAHDDLMRWSADHLVAL